MRGTWNNVTCNSIKTSSVNRRMRLLWPPPPLHVLHRPSQQRCVLFVHIFFLLSDATIRMCSTESALVCVCVCVCIKLDAMRIRVWFSLTRWAYVIPIKMSKRVHFCRQPCSSGTACASLFARLYQCQYEENPCIEIAKKIELHAHFPVVTWSVGGCVRATTHSDRCTEGDYCIFVCEVMSTRRSKCIGDW